MLDPTDPAFAPFLHPAVLPPVSDVPPEYDSLEHAVPGHPVHPRMPLAPLFLQLGVYLDYYTGAHGLSAVVGDALEEEKRVERLLAQSGALSLFPQFSTGADAGASASKWPPTIFCHGTEDSAVPVGESQYLAALLGRAGVEVKMLEFEGEEHSFDYAPGAEEKYAKEFDEVGEFLERCLNLGKGRV